MIIECFWLEGALTTNEFQPPLPAAGTHSSRGVNYSSFITSILALNIGRRKKNRNKKATTKKQLRGRKTVIK